MKSGESMPKHSSLTLSVEDEDKFFLDQLAKRFNYPSRSALIKGMRRGELQVTLSSSPTKKETRAINAAIACLEKALMVLQNQR
jgi:hypothetical protein